MSKRKTSVRDNPREYSRFNGRKKDSKSMAHRINRHKGKAALRREVENGAV